MKFVKNSIKSRAGTIGLAALVATSLLVGTAYAAKAKLISGKQIARNAVTTQHVRNNSLTGADIKNGSIARSDLAPALRKSMVGKTGAKGDTGAPGAPGAPGATGATGPQGPAGIAPEYAVVELVYTNRAGQEKWKSGPSATVLLSEATGMRQTAQLSMMHYCNGNTTYTCQFGVRTTYVSPRAGATVTALPNVHVYSAEAQSGSLKQQPSAAAMTYEGRVTMNSAMNIVATPQFSEPVFTTTSSGHGGIQPFTATLLAVAPGASQILTPRPAVASPAPLTLGSGNSVYRLDVEVNFSATP